MMVRRFLEKCYLRSIRVCISIITVGPRVLQNIFYFCNFLVSEGSFRYLKMPQFITKFFEQQKKTKIDLESLGFELMTPLRPILHSKKCHFQFIFSHRIRGSTWMTNICTESPKSPLLDRKGPSIALVR